MDEQQTDKEAFPKVEAEMNTVRSKKVFKKIGPGDKTSHEGEPVFRADAIPDFVTPDWVNKNIGLTNADCHSMSKAYAKDLPSWNGKESSEGTFPAKFARDIGIVNFMRYGWFAIPKKKRRKYHLPFYSMMNAIYLSRVRMDGKRDQSITITKVREVLAEHGDWEDLCQLMFIEFLSNNEPDHVEEMLGRHKELKNRIGPFCDSYKKKKEQVDRILEKKEEKRRKNNKREKQKNKKDLEKQKKKREQEIQNRQKKREQLKKKKERELQKPKKPTKGTKKSEKGKPTPKKERAPVGTGAGFLQSMFSRIEDTEGARGREELVALIAELESLSQKHVEFEPKIQKKMNAAVERIVSALSEILTVAETVTAAMLKNDQHEMAAALKQGEEAQADISQAITDIRASLDSGKDQGSIEVQKTELPPTAFVEPEPFERPVVGNEEIEGIEEASTKRPDDQVSSTVNELITQLLDRGNIGLAYHVGQFGVNNCEPELLTFPVPILRLLAISGSIKGVLGDRIQATQSLVQDVSRILEETDASSQRSLALEALVIASALEPALFSSVSMANSLFLGKGRQYLHSLAGLFPKISPIIKTVEQIPTFGIVVTPSNIRGLQKEDTWKSAIEEHQRELQAWFERAKHKKLIGPASIVWQDIVKPRGPIGIVVNKLIDNKRGAAVEARAFVASYTDPREADALIKATDHRIRGSRNPIEARALRAMRKLISETVAIINAHVGLLESKPDSQVGHEQRVIQKLRMELRTAIKPAVPDINDWLTEGDRERVPSFLIASIRCLHRSLERLLNLIEGNVVEDLTIRAEEELLGMDLPFVRGVHFLGTWEPDMSQPDVFIHSIKDFLTQGDKTTAKAFAEKMEDNNHIATSHLLDRMGHKDNEVIDSRRLNELSKERKQAIATARSKLQNEKENAENSLNRAVGMSLFNDNDFIQYRERLNAIEPKSLPNISYDDDQRRSIRVVDFPTAHRVIEEVKEQIVDHERSRCESLLKDLKKLKDEGSCSVEDAQSIQKMIKEHDLLLVETCLSTVAGTGKLPTKKVGNQHIKEFFQYFVSKVSKNLKKKRNGLDKEAAEEFQRDQKIAGIDYSNVDRSRMESAITLLRSWTSVGGASGRTTNRLRQIMEAIGFAVLDSGIERVARKHRNSKYPEFTMRCKPIQDRSICPVHQYGSGAEGRYRLVLVTKNQTIPELVGALAANQGRATLLFYRGLLNQSQRKTFIKEIYRATGGSGLLIDDSTILYLCRISDFRLPVMFQITLPFTKVNPYWIERGKTPVEMFYGRKEELEQIIDPSGSNLVYGGRMLGKTALLYQIQNLHDHPSAGTHVIYQDLKVAGNILGQKKAQEFQSNPSLIWELIAHHLVERKLIKIEAKEDSMVDQVNQKVRAWIDENPDRRLLLLLDEADNFLKTDSQHQHTNVGEMKNLMDVTSARFKVVLAGLHNVQRTIQDPNSPIARMGQPICVGPLTDTDRLEAYNMVTEPFSACGYEFKSSDLAMKVLSQTNSYPSLIQVFCYTLLAYVGKDQSFLGDGPPYRITKPTLEDATQQETMRSQIVTRFEATLNLDTRYAMIAHVISLETIYDMDESRVVEGFYTRDIRKEILSYGSGPFGEDTSLNIFTALLDEMVGLGVLEMIEGRYQLKSTTILTMMGSRNKIEDRITDLATLEAQVHYDPENFHMGYGDDPLLRSPLTFRQEAELLRETKGKQPSLFLVFGSQLAGIDEVADIIEHRATNNRWPLIKTEGALQVQQVHNIVKRYASRAHLRPIIVVPRTVPWTSTWVTKALDWPEIKRGKVRLVFLGGGNAALDWVKEGKPGDTKDNVHVVSVSPWSTSSVKQWIEDEDLVAAFGSGEGHHDLIAKTGLLTKPLMKVRRIIREEPDLSTALDQWREASKTKELLEQVGIPRDLVSFMKQVGEFADISDGKMTIPQEDIELIFSDDVSNMPINLPTLVEWGDLMAIWEPAPEDRLNLSRLIFDIARTGP